LLGVVDEVFAVDQAAVERAKEIVLGQKGLSPRDAVHLAMMQIHGIKRILSFDRGFDGFPRNHSLVLRPLPVSDAEWGYYVVEGFSTVWEVVQCLS